MKKGTLFFLLLCVFGGFTLAVLTKPGSASPAPAQELEDLFSTNLQENEVAYVFLGYSGVIIRVANYTILIDPANLLKSGDMELLKTNGVDFLLFTHTHGDHYNLGKALDIFKAGEPYVVAGPEVARNFEGKIPAEKLISLTSGKPQNLKGLSLEAVEGSHIGPITLFRIKAGNVHIFHGGDSSYVDMKNFPSDLAFLPTGDPSPTASPEKAMRMAADLKPQIAVAIHGSDSQNQEFIKLMKEKFPETTVMNPARRTVKRVQIK